MQGNSSLEKQPQLTEETKSFPLSYGQQAMWFLYQIAPQSIAYNPFSHSPSSEEFLTEVKQLVKKSKIEFGCAAMVVSVGYDIIINDPHGGWELPPAIFEEIGQILAQASIPLCLVQEGGYLLNALDECAYKFGLGLLGR